MGPDGELSAARHALEGAELAPGTLATLRAVTDPDKRPPVPRSPSPEDLMDLRTHLPPTGEELQVARQA